MAGDKPLERVLVRGLTCSGQAPPVTLDEAANTSARHELVGARVRAGYYDTILPDAASMTHLDAGCKVHQVTIVFYCYDLRVRDFVSSCTRCLLQSVYICTGLYKFNRLLCVR